MSGGIGGGGQGADASNPGMPPRAGSDHGPHNGSEWVSHQRGPPMQGERLNHIPPPHWAPYDPRWTAMPPFMDPHYGQRTPLGMQGKDKDWRFLKSNY